MQGKALQKPWEMLSGRGEAYAHFYSLKTGGGLLLFFFLE